MSFGYPLPPWAFAAAVALSVIVAWRAYTGSPLRLRSSQRAVLIALRSLVFVALVFLLLRPLGHGTPVRQDATVPVLVDVSRSMAIADADGRRRLDHAVDLVANTIVPRLSGYKVEIFRFADVVEPATADSMKEVSGRGTNLAGALAALSERTGGRGVAGIVVVSDGGDNASLPPEAHVRPGGPPVIAIGVGGEEIADREVRSIAASDPRMSEASIDLAVDVVSRNLGSEPFSVELTRNGRLIETRAVRPSDDGSPVRTVFAASVDTGSPVVYGVRIPEAEGEATAANNEAAIVVNPPDRKRRVLFVQGQPGFEHSFLRRAWERDPALEVDIVILKGTDGQGRGSFLITAPPARAVALSSGFPKTREALFAYDAVVVASAGWDFLSRGQAESLVEFVARRGGGLLVIGERSLEPAALGPTGLAEVLPVEVVRTTSVTPARTDERAARLAAEGVSHPATRLAPRPDENEKRWRQLPPLPVVPLGRPRPGATVLLEGARSGAAPRPLLAVQRYGAGRSMVFGGQASWRWKMARPSDDRTYETFWRQAVRWLVESVPQPVELSVHSVEPGPAIDISVTVLDESFEPVNDASLVAEIAPADGDPRVVSIPLSGHDRGVYSLRVPLETPGLHRIEVNVSRGDKPFGSAGRAVIVGGADPEMIDPAADASVLLRLAELTGGTYLTAERASDVPAALGRTAPIRTASLVDLWHTPWVLGLIVAMVTMEWVLRRRWGLR